MSSGVSSQEQPHSRSRTPQALGQRSPAALGEVQTRGRTRSRSVSDIRAGSAEVRRRSASLSQSRSQSHSAHLQAIRASHSTRGHRRSRSRSQSRSRTPNRDDRRSYRQRSYSRESSRQDRRLESSKIVVEKLTKNITEAHLQEIFGAYGRIQSIDLPINRQFMMNRGNAYIVYESAAGSESAIAHMHEAQLDGVVITVSVVLPRRAFSESPPPARGDRRSYLAPRYQDEALVYRSPPTRRGAYSDRRLPINSLRHDRRTRSRSPPRRRERSDTNDSRSPSRTPPRRRARDAPRRRRRSSSYTSYTTATRSRTRSESRARYSGRR